MARKSFVLVLLAMLVAVGLSFTGCAHHATRNGVNTPLGVLTSAGAVQDDRAVIASYTIILGLITSGYEEFLRATAGRDFDLVSRWMVFTTTVKAVERDGRGAAAPAPAPTPAPAPEAAE